MKGKPPPPPKKERHSVKHILGVFTSKAPLDIMYDAMRLSTKIDDPYPMVSKNINQQFYHVIPPDNEI